MMRCIPLLITVLLCACRSDDVTGANGGGSVQGIWAGVVEGPAPTPLRLTLIDAGGAVTGTVELGSLVANVEGTFHAPRLRLDVELMLTLDDSLWFEAQLVQPDSMAGFSHSRVVLTYTDPGGNVREEISRDSARFGAARQ